MHRAGYVCGCVAIRGVASHRGCGAGPGPVVGLLACPSLCRSPRRSCCASSSCRYSCVRVWPYMQRSRPRSGGGGSSADPRWWSSGPTRVVPGGCAARRCPGRHGRYSEGHRRYEISSEGALLGLVRKVVQAKGKSRLWEAAPRRLRLSCRRLRGCLRGQVAQFGVRRDATGPPDDGQGEAAHLAPHLLTRTGFHRTRLLLRGEPVARPFAGCDELRPTSTEFLGRFVAGVHHRPESLIGQGFRQQLRKFAGQRTRRRRTLERAEGVAAGMACRTRPAGLPLLGTVLPGFDSHQRLSSGRPRFGAPG